MMIRKAHLYSIEDIGDGVEPRRLDRRYQVRWAIHFDVVLAPWAFVVVGRQRRVLFGVAVRGTLLGKRVVRGRDGLTL